MFRLSKACLVNIPSSKSFSPLRWAAKSLPPGAVRYGGSITSITSSLGLSPPSRVRSPSREPRRPGLCAVTLPTVVPTWGAKLHVDGGVGSRRTNQLAGQRETSGGELAGSSKPSGETSMARNRSTKFGSRYIAVPVCIQVRRIRCDVARESLVEAPRGSDAHARRTADEKLDQRPRGSRLSTL